MEFNGAGLKKITSANHCPLRQCKSTLLDTEPTPFSGSLAKIGGILLEIVYEQE